MLQRFRGTQSGVITAVDAAAAAFPTLVVGVVYLQPGSGNAGTVTVKATDVGNQYATGGLILSATSQIVALGPLENFQALTYQFSNVGDTLNWLVLN